MKTKGKRIALLQSVVEEIVNQTLKREETERTLWKVENTERTKMEKTTAGKTVMLKVQKKKDLANIIRKRKKVKKVLHLKFLLTEERKIGEIVKNMLTDEEMKEEKMKNLRGGRSPQRKVIDIEMTEQLIDARKAPHLLISTKEGKRKRRMLKSWRGRKKRREMTG